MTPPDPKPTAPPTVAPASYDQVKRYLNYHGHINVRMANEIEARIESDRARIAELEARTGCEHCSDRRREAEATIAKQAEEIERWKSLAMEAYEDIHSWGAYASDYFQKKHDLTGCAEKYRRAALSALPDAKTKKEKR